MSLNPLLNSRLAPNGRKLRSWRTRRNTLWGGKGEIPHLIEKEGAAVRLLNQTLMDFVGSRKGALFVTKKDALDE